MRFDPLDIRPFFQPIESLQSGKTIGFEALARLDVDGAILAPDQFLVGLSQDALLDVFGVMLAKSIALIKSLPVSEPPLYVSVNIETSLLLRPGFCDYLRAILAKNNHTGEQLVLELLEGDQITDYDQMHKALNRVRKYGIQVALDDIGSAYSSLINLKTLPIDIIKLDRSFARGLNENPEDLHFVLSILSLARGLGKKLIVEGVETFEIRDALRVLGVDCVQGYAIARPMPPENVMAWTESRVAVQRDRTPQTMLGAYAGHLTVVETCRVLMHQPLQVAWKEESKDPHSCAIGKYFDQHHIHDTPYGIAHKRFHEVMALYDTNPVQWRESADGFRLALTDEILGHQRREFRCDPVAGAIQPTAY